jgi:hypothetical protein
MNIITTKETAVGALQTVYSAINDQFEKAHK